MAATLVVVSPSAEPQSWQEIYIDEGITVHKRDVPGSSFFEFRGRGVVASSIKQILAVLHDQKRKTDWMHSCVENQLLYAGGVGELVIYNRTGSPVPLVSDRDVVVKSSLQYWPDERHVRIEVRDVKHERAPPRDGVVRMPDLEVVWDLIALDARSTYATYQVRADPGGLLPAWLVNLASKRIPFHTLRNLREEVKKDYDESLAVVDMGFDWASVGL